MKFLRTAAAIAIVSGAGFAIGTAVTIAHLERHGELPMTPFGFHSLAGGYFERLGPELLPNSAGRLWESVRLT